MKEEWKVWKPLIASYLRSRFIRCAYLFGVIFEFFLIVNQWQEVKPIWDSTFSRGGFEEAAMILLGGALLASPIYGFGISVLAFPFWLLWTDIDQDKSEVKQ